VLYTSGSESFEGIEQRITELMSIPSPYLTGLLDKFFDQGLRPLIEFTRGCRYACTFCTDFRPHRNKVAWRTSDVAREEMEYIARHMNMVLADLNFGQYIQDIEIAKIIRGTIDRSVWLAEYQLLKANAERVPVAASYLGSTLNQWRD
jgi:tRNA A37 methylthiotransferase MiaB